MFIYNTQSYDKGNAERNIAQGHKEFGQRGNNALLEEKEKIRNAVTLATQETKVIS